MKTMIFDIVLSGKVLRPCPCKLRLLHQLDEEEWEEEQGGCSFISSNWLGRGGRVPNSWDDADVHNGVASGDAGSFRGQSGHYLRPASESIR